MSEQTDGDPLLQTIVGGRFRLEARVGSGAMGPTYRAYDEKTGGRAAVKVFAPAWAADLSAARRIQRDASRVGPLQSATVVDVLDVGRMPDGRPYLASDWVHGVDLEHVMASGGRLMPGEAATLLAPIAATLDAVHATGVLHRVLKPSKLILNRSTQGAPIRLAGFGVGALLTPDASAARPTREVSAYGAAAYMAPEADGTRVDHRADVYSLGVIAFQLITGRLPFQSDEALLLMVAKKTKKSPSLKEISGVEHSTAAESVLAATLATRAEDRYPSAGAFIEDLLRAANGRPVWGPKPAGLPGDDAMPPGDFGSPAEIVQDLLAVSAQAAMSQLRAARAPLLTPVHVERPPAAAFRTEPPASDAEPVEAAPARIPSAGIPPEALDSVPPGSEASTAPPSAPPAEATTEPPPALAQADTAPPPDIATRPTAQLVTVADSPASEPPDPIGPRDTQAMTALEIAALESVGSPLAQPEPRAPEPSPSAPPVPFELSPRSSGRSARQAVPLDASAVQREVEARRKKRETPVAVPAAPEPGRFRVALMIAATLIAIIAVALVVRLVVGPLLARAPEAPSAPVATPPR